MITDKLLQEMLPTPVALLSFLNDEESMEKINALLPYSTGFEIECDTAEEHNELAFQSIPDIMSVDSHKHSGEQRFRIPNGLRGILCLYHICDQLRTNCLLNYGSGIHYHVDCTDCWSSIQKRMNNAMANEILLELDTWEYAGKYNARGFNGEFAYPIKSGNWVRFNGLQTMEFRIGEMTFDYNLMLKRIMHCNSLVKSLKDICCTPKEIVYEPINLNAILNYDVKFGGNTYSINQKILKLQKELLELKEVEEPKTPFEVFKEGIKGRLHKLY